MIQDIKIERFRGFSQLNMLDCAQFNLILGENNSGKSSLLEAILLLSGPNNPTLNTLINAIRGWQAKDKDEAKIIFYAEDASQPITLWMQTETGESRKMEINLLHQAEEVINIDKIRDVPASNQSKEAYKYAINTTLSDNTKQSAIHSELTFDPINKKIIAKGDESYTELLAANYLPPVIGFTNDMQGFDKMVEQKEKHILIEALQFLEPNLKDIAKIKDRIWVDLGYEQMLPSNVLGDGFRKVMSLITQVYNSQNGILLIDEIDNGMHFKSLKLMWKSLLKVAESYHVQIFATSHNIDSIQAYNQVLEESDLASCQDKARIFALRKLPDNHPKTYKYTYKQFNYLINEEIELR
ncbi:ATP/GTP-binding protein [Bacteroides sp. 224]|uniref:AAA family ATPase n=1 Tax=Bacteroides sp. 224 TaxID=2302936 RepID=UPI0013D5EB51|nr:AAA family ATPase [Bacteroides sp. 224]NDV64151.1 DUF2813 domain-containing protein [Bacteroides sp. 224]